MRQRSLQKIIGDRPQLLHPCCQSSILCDQKLVGWLLIERAVDMAPSGQTTNTTSLLSATPTQRPNVDAMVVDGVGS